MSLKIKTNIIEKDNWWSFNWYLLIIKILYIFVQISLSLWEILLKVLLLLLLFWLFWVWLLLLGEWQRPLMI